MRVLESVLAGAKTNVNSRRWMLIGLATVVVTMGVSVNLPGMMPGFLPFLLAILGPVLAVVLVWSTRDLGEVIPPVGIDEARALLVAAPVPLCIVSFSGKLFFANPECGSLGMDTGEYPGGKLFQYLHPDDAATLLRVLEEMSKEADSVEQIQIRFGTAEASFPVVAQIARLQRRGEAVVVLTEPIEYPEHLADDSVLFQQKMEAICHGTQGPLVGIAGVASTLANSNPDAGMIPWMEQLLASSHQLSQSVEDLRYLVDIRGGHKRVKEVPTRMTHVLDSLVAEVLRENDWPAPIVPMIEKGVPDWVMVDVFCLRRVLITLIHSAMLENPYSEIAIRVSVDGYERSRAQFSFSAYPTGENPASTIRDSLGSKVSRSMAVAQQFAECIGGNIRRVMHDEICHFVFEVGARQSPPQLAQREETRWGGTRVILVDRTGLRRRSLQHRLERMGMQLEVVPDGKLALATLKRDTKGASPYGLLIYFDDLDADWGETLTAQARSVSKNPPGVLRILPFGWQDGQKEGRSEWDVSEGVAVLRDPVQHDELVAVLETLVSKWSPMMQITEAP